MSGPRGFTGPLEPLAKIIQEHAYRPDFLEYGEDMGRSPVDSAVLLKHRQLWCKLYRAHPSLMFTQKQAITLFDKVADLQSRVWARPLGKNELVSYTTRMALRFRTALRHINATHVKHPKTTWLLKIFEESKRTSTADDGQVDDETQRYIEGTSERENGDLFDEDNESELQEGPDEEVDPDAAQSSEPPIETPAPPMKKPSAAAEASYFYGIDWFLRANGAYRMKDKASGKEYAARLEASDGDHPVAFWRDSDVGVEIKAITSQEFAEMVASDGASNTRFWSGKTTSGSVVRVSRHRYSHES